MLPESAGARRSSPEPPRSNKDLLIGGVVVVVAAVLIIGSGVWSRATHENDPSAAQPAAATNPPESPTAGKKTAPLRGQKAAASALEGPSIPGTFNARCLQAQGASWNGIIQLVPGRLIYSSPAHSFTLMRSQIRSVDGNALVDSTGKRWRFVFDGMNSAQSHNLLARWLATEPPPQAPAVPY